MYQNVFTIIEFGLVHLKKVKVKLLKKCILTPKTVFVLLESVIDSDYIIFIDLFSLMKF